MRLASLVLRFSRPAMKASVLRPPCAAVFLPDADYQMSSPSVVPHPSWQRVLAAVFASPAWLLRTLEYGGAALGMAGSLWMAAGVPSSRLAWWVWLASNALLILWALRVRARGILAMQMFYFVTSLIGVVRH
jgi:hypothetical protein